MGKLSIDLRKEVRQRLEAEESQREAQGGAHTGVACERTPAGSQGEAGSLEADSGSGSDSES
eukprot:2739823-Prymnesium_polylepis.1